MRRDQTGPTSRNRAALRLGVALWAMAFGGVFALTNPPLEAPDEPAHLVTVNFIASRGSLPNPLVPEQNTGEAHQHPLYYLAAAGIVKALCSDGSIDVRSEPNPAFRPLPGERTLVAKYVHGPAEDFSSDGDRRAFFALRLLNVLLAAGTALLAMRGMELLWTDGPWPLAGVFVAALPQFQFIGGSISNDALSAFLASGATVAAIAAIRNPEAANKWIAFGVWAGLAFLAKKSNLALLAWLPCVLLAAQGRGGWGPMARSFGLAIAPVALLALPLALRNLALFGGPLGGDAEAEVMRALAEPRAIGDPYFRSTFLAVTARSFFGHFGWMHVYVPSVALALLGCAYGLGWLASLVGLRSPGRASDAALWSLPPIVLGGLAWYNLTFTQPQGRLLFPALAALAILAGVGWGRIVSRLPLPGRIFATSSALLALLVADVLCAAENLRFYSS
jgi:hypothetical protein